MGKRYGSLTPLPVYTQNSLREEVQNNVLLMPVSIKIRELGRMLPVSFGGLDVPYVNQSIKEALEARLSSHIQFFPLKVQGTELKYYIMNVLKALDAMSASSEVEYYTESSILDYPERAERIKYLRNLVLSQDKTPKDTKIFRLKNWLGAICIDEEVKALIESVDKNHGMLFKKIAME